MDDTLSELDLHKIEMFLMGDFNIDTLDKKNDSISKLLHMIKQHGLRQLIKEPTRFSANKNSLIDLLITNSDIVSKSGVANVNLSDHQMILLTRKKIKIIFKKSDFTGRSYRNYKKENFQLNFQNLSWFEFDNAQTVSEKWTILLDNIRKEIDKSCPLRNFKIKQEKEPWISPDLIELIKDNNKALKIAKKIKDPELWIEAKALRNRCTQRLRQAKADFISDNLNNNIGNQKKFWKNIQSLLPNKTPGSQTFRLTHDILRIDTSGQLPYQKKGDFSWSK